MKNLKISIFLLFIASPGLSFAEPNASLVQFFSSQIENVENSGLTDVKSVAPFTISDINVDLFPSVSFGLTDVASLTVTPEIDLIYVPVTPE